MDSRTKRFLQFKYSITAHVMYLLEENQVALDGIETSRVHLYLAAGLGLATSPNEALALLPSGGERMFPKLNVPPEDNVENIRAERYSSLLKQYAKEYEVLQALDFMLSIKGDD